MESFASIKDIGESHLKANVCPHRGESHAKIWLIFLEHHFQLGYFTVLNDLLKELKCSVIIVLDPLKPLICGIGVF